MTKIVHPASFLKEIESDLDRADRFFRESDSEVGAEYGSFKLDLFYQPDEFYNVHHVFLCHLPTNSFWEKKFLEGFDQLHIDETVWFQVFPKAIVTYEAANPMSSYWKNND